MKRWCWAGLLLALGCGDEPEAAQGELAFTAHRLECDLEGIGAWLQIDGVGTCTLEVAEDRTVSGRCYPIPGGQGHTLNLVYWFSYEGVRLEVARASVYYDFSDEDKAVVPIDFTGAPLSYPDDDRDGRPNLQELCLGQDPTDPNG